MFPHLPVHRMVIVTANTKLPGYSNVSSQNNLRSIGKKNLRKRFMHLVICLLFLSLIFKFLIEISYHEKLAVKNFHKSFRIKKHEFEQNIDPYQDHLLPADSNSSLYSVEDEILDVEIIDLPSETMLLNITHFKWIRNNESLCQKESLFVKILPVLVHTARNHFVERQAIRNTWASFQNYENWSVRPVFLMGEANPNSVPSIRQSEEEKLDHEHLIHGDIITGSFVDAYKNLTYKHLMGYKWILEHCQNADFVLKTDDDMFVDILQFIDMRNNESRIEDSSNQLQQEEKSSVDMYCYEFKGGIPLRCKGCKWHVSLEEWPEEKFPWYCSGWAYGITVDWINKIYLMSYQTKYFWIDDVFIGILMNMAISFFKTEPSFQSLNSLYTFNNKLYLDMCANQSNDLANATRSFGAVVYIARNQNFSKEMECLWNKTLVDKMSNSF
ncbi:unnamed protein product [Orchesella dallaii]|uniref:Hexosyltransferase n=1 Tax=Orchesella dallaii TaxID=48710 RepID=A0ABP1R9X2_9HEXA